MALITENVKPKPESKNFLLLLLGKNYGIYLNLGIYLR